MAEPREAQWQPELRLLLIGKIGVGKSATGNSILGNPVFASSAGFASVTQCCQLEKATIEGRKIVVVDTPGFCDSDDRRAFKRKDLETCLALLSPGPHAIVFVSRCGQLTKEDVEVIQDVNKLFRNEGRHFLVLLFTHKDHIDCGDMTLDIFLDLTERTLKDLVHTCGNRCVAFNNRAEGEEMSRQVMELIDMVEAMMRRNADKPCYSLELYEKDKPICLFF